MDSERHDYLGKEVAIPSFIQGISTVAVEIDDGYLWEQQSQSLLLFRAFQHEAILNVYKAPMPVSQSLLLFRAFQQVVHVLRSYS